VTTDTGVPALAETLEQETPLRNPCGLTDCCVDRMNYEPRKESAARPTEAQLAAAPERAAEITERFERIDREVAIHELGHVTVALALGADIKFVRLGAKEGHVETDGVIEGLDRLVYILGGPAAEVFVTRVFGTYWHAAYAYLALARAGKAGTCDACKVMKRLVEIAPEDSDENLVWHYRRFWSKAAAILDRIEVRCALFKLADELQQRRLLTGAEIAEIVDVEMLKAVKADLEQPE
jgi:hypothetical protein